MRPKTRLHIIAGAQHRPKVGPNRPTRGSGNQICRDIGPFASGNNMLFRLTAFNNTDFWWSFFPCEKFFLQGKNFTPSAPPTKISLKTPGTTFLLNVFIKIVFFLLRIST